MKRPQIKYAVVVRQDGTFTAHYSPHDTDGADAEFDTLSGAIGWIERKARQDMTSPLRVAYFEEVPITLYSLKRIPREVIRARQGQ